MMRRIVCNASTGLKCPGPRLDPEGRQNYAAGDKSVGGNENERYTAWGINRSYPHNASRRQSERRYIRRVGSRPHGPGGGIAAVERAKGRVITVSIDAMTFIKPIQVGDVLEVYTELESVGHTSIKIHIEAWAQRIQTYERDKVTNATFTFVHVGEDGRPRAVPAMLERPLSEQGTADEVRALIPVKMTN